MNHDQVWISDTTLPAMRACHGGLSRQQMLRMASALVELGVDAMSLGRLPRKASTVSALSQVAQSLHNQEAVLDVVAFDDDLEAACQLLTKAHKPRINVCVVLGAQTDNNQSLSIDTLEQKLTGMVQPIVASGIKVEVTVQDAWHHQRELLARLATNLATSGVDAFTLADAASALMPTEVASLTAYLEAQLSSSTGMRLGVALHNQLGLASGNTLMALAHGANAAKCALNGVGGDFGSAALEEVAMALKMRAQAFKLECQLVNEKLYPAARTLAQITGQPIARNKPVIGVDAFDPAYAHSASLLGSDCRYMSPADVGMPVTRLVLNKDSSQALLGKRLAELGQPLSGHDLDALFVKFQELASRKRDIHDGDLEALVAGQDPVLEGPWWIAHLHTVSNLGGHASASMGLKHDNGTKVGETATGDGPVDAVLRAFERAFSQPLKLIDFSIHAISQGGDAQGMVTLDVEFEGHLWHGQGVSTDIVAASAYAALEVINAIARTQQSVKNEETNHE